MRSCIDSCCIYSACLSPDLIRSLEIQHFERSDVIEICDGTALHWVTGLCTTDGFCVDPDVIRLTLLSLFCVGAAVRKQWD